MTDRFSDAFGNIASYNGNEEWLWEMADKLREVEEGKNFCLGVPPEGWITARPALWMMLVSAFAGRENVLAAYEAAVQERYRFFSFGDAMYIG